MSSTHAFHPSNTHRPSAWERQCSECAGAGVFFTDNGPAPGETDCETCGATGYVEMDEQDDDPFFGCRIGPISRFLGDALPW